MHNQRVLYVPLHIQTIFYLSNQAQSNFDSINSTFCWNNYTCTSSYTFQSISRDNTIYIVRIYILSLSNPQCLNVHHIRNIYFSYLHLCSYVLCLYSYTYYLYVLRFCLYTYYLHVLCLCSYIHAYSYLNLCSYFHPYS